MLALWGRFGQAILLPALGSTGWLVGNVTRRFGKPGTRLDTFRLRTQFVILEFHGNQAAVRSYDLAREVQRKPGDVPADNRPVDRELD